MRSLSAGSDTAFFGFFELPVLDALADDFRTLFPGVASLLSDLVETGDLALATDFEDFDLDRLFPELFLREDLTGETSFAVLAGESE